MTATLYTVDTDPDILWDLATADLRRELTESLYPEAEAEVKADRKRKSEKPLTPLEKTYARNIVRGLVIRHLYHLESHEGVRNPIWDDPEWSPARPSKTAEIATEAKEEANLADLATWLETQTWSDFAQSLAKQYRSKGSLSPKQVAAAESMRAKVKPAPEAAPKVSVPEFPDVDQTPSGLDLHELPSGYYAVPGGETRLKVRVAHGKPGTKWAGWTFVSDGAEYGQRRAYGSQRPEGLYKGEIQEALTAILENPLEAQKAYGQLTGTCGACGRILEDESSIANGIGPVCAMKWVA